MRKLEDEIEKSVGRMNERSTTASGEEHFPTLLRGGLWLGNVAEELQNSRLVLRRIRLMKIDMPRIWHEPKLFRFQSLRKKHSRVLGCGVAVFGAVDD